MDGAGQLNRVKGFEGALGEDHLLLVPKSSSLEREEGLLLLVQTIHTERLECLLEVVDIADKLECASSSEIAALQILISYLVIPLQRLEHRHRQVLGWHQASNELDLFILDRNHLDQLNGQHRNVEHAEVLLLALLHVQHCSRCLLVLELRLLPLLLLLLLLLVEKLIELLDEADEVVADVASVVARRRRL